MRECQIIHSIALWSINASMNATSRKKCSSRRSLLIMKAPSEVWHNLTCSGFLYHQRSYLLGMLLQFTSLEHLQRCSVCDPAKIFFTSKFSYILFFATHWTNYYDRPIRNTEQQSDPIYYTLFRKSHSCTEPFTSSLKLYTCAEPKLLS